MENNRIIGYGFLVFIIGSTLADSPNLLPCIVIDCIGFALMAIGLHRYKEGKEE